jgi:2-polyprenyl-6-methoxyphenol hydroxylase-like FAD-dependent oxidoreductase
MMLGLLLARAGIEVVVLEKHADFLRDFRGDTIHPSTLELLFELGLIDEFLKRPHQQVREVHGVVGGEEFRFADFSHLPTHCKFLAFMPQWDFLDFLAEHGRKYPAFRLMMQAEVTDLLREQERVVGVRGTSPGGTFEVRAPLTVGCDGRHSTVRGQAALPVEDLGSPIDVLWFKVSRKPDDPEQPLGRFGTGAALIMLNRDAYWQCAFVIPKGGNEQLRAAGLDAFRRRIVEIAPLLADRAGQLADWDQVKLLTVMVDRLERWHLPGLLCIGDAAHAMSPVGGVGINLAIQDAVATANRLVEPLRGGTLTEEDLAAIQERRMFPTRWTQRIQIFIHRHVLEPVLGSARPPHLPWPVEQLLKIPQVRRIPARLIGLGFRPEHVQTPDVFGGQLSGAKDE